MEPIFAIFVLFICAASYFLPGIVAMIRGHRQTLAIFMLTLFTAWSGIGWIIALVWACTSDLKETKK